MLRATVSGRSRLGIVVAGLAWLCSAGALLIPNTRAAQNDKKPEQTFEPQKKTLQTKDKGAIHITYYRSNGGKNSPVVVLLHMNDGNRLLWESKGGFAELLQHEGYAVITVDLRYHGESKAAGATTAANANQPADKKKKSGKVAAGPELKPADYRAMVEYDMAAVKEFIYQEHQEENLNMNKLGIVGPEMGANVAFEFAAADWAKAPHNDGQPGYQTPRGQDVRALALISPNTTFQGLSISKSIKDLRDPRKGVAFLVCFSKDDPEDKGHSKKIFEQLTVPSDHEKRMYMQEFEGKLRGTQLLGTRSGVEKYLLAFFNEHLKKLDSNWRDRESKLDKLGKKK